jgi:uncharacterized protein
VLPVITQLNHHFWTGGFENELRILACQDCATLVHPASPVCPLCRARHLAPQCLSGRGRVYSFTVNHQPWSQALATPYVIAIVELEEQPGLRLTTRLVECSPEQVKIGMAVEVTFDCIEDVALPLFRPALFRPAS